MRKLCSILQYHPRLLPFLGYEHMHTWIILYEYHVPYTVACSIQISSSWHHSLNIVAQNHTHWNLDFCFSLGTLFQESIIKGKLQYHPNECPFFSISYNDLLYYFMYFYYTPEYNTRYFVTFYLMRKLCSILQYHPCLLPFFAISSIFRSTRLPSSSSTPLMVLRDVRRTKIKKMLN